jgi:hypothetical protein
MARRSNLLKTTDYETCFGCAGGIGILREEVWVNDKSEVIQYNLAFLMPHLYGIDNGRVLGYDNAHGIHERHFMGQVSHAEFNDYVTTADHFYREVETIRRSYENSVVRGRI